LHPPSVLLASDSFERLKTLHYRSGSGRKAKEAHFYPTSGTVPIICGLSSVFIFFTTTILSHFSSIPKLSLLLLLLILPLSTRHCSLILRSLPTKSHTSKSKANSPKAPVNLTRVYRERCTLCKLKCDQRMLGAQICPVLCAKLRSMDIARQRLARSSSLAASRTQTPSFLDGSARRGLQEDLRLLGDLRIILAIREQRLVVDIDSSINLEITNFPFFINFLSKAKHFLP
jgi:hypothetical protein